MLLMQGRVSAAQPGRHKTSESLAVHKIDGLYMSEFMRKATIRALRRQVKRHFTERRNNASRLSVFTRSNSTQCTSCRACAKLRAQGTVFSSQGFVLAAHC